MNAEDCDRLFRELRELREAIYQTFAPTPVNAQLNRVDKTDNRKIDVTLNVTSGFPAFRIYEGPSLSTHGYTSQAAEVQLNIIRDTGREAPQQFDGIAFRAALEGRFGLAAWTVMAWSDFLTPQAGYLPTTSAYTFGPALRAFGSGALEIRATLWASNTNPDRRIEARVNSAVVAFPTI